MPCSLKSIDAVLRRGISATAPAEIGLSQHGGIDYHGLVYLLDQVSSAKGLCIRWKRGPVSLYKFSILKILSSHRRSFTMRSSCRFFLSTALLGALHSGPCICPADMAKIDQLLKTSP
jgi:hypothetical protein